MRLLCPILKIKDKKKEATYGNMCWNFRNFMQNEENSTQKNFYAY